MTRVSDFIGGAVGPKLDAAVGDPSIAAQFRDATEASGLNSLLERMMGPKEKSTHPLQSLLDPIPSNPLLTDTLNRMSSISEELQRSIAGVNVGLPQSYMPNFEMPSFKPPAFETHTLEIPNFEIPPNPINKTNDLLAKMIVKSDELLSVQAQQAALIQKLADLSAISLEHARLSATESAQATRLAEKSEKAARWAVYITIISLAVSIAFSSLQTWMSWDGGRETDAVLNDILKAVRQDDAPANPDAPAPPTPIVTQDKLAN
ncbi:MAG: hypothetical protein E6Q98_23015 [Rhodospirillaceae bacterium]|nr:MAG: hypothetical protein E6Q98_23015 [Rhodospirillaceae bacterium]